MKKNFTITPLGKADFSIEIRNQYQEYLAKFPWDYTIFDRWNLQSFWLFMHEKGKPEYQKSHETN